MSVEIVNPSEPVTVTEAARRHFGDQCKQAAGSAVYLKLKESGCTGYMYVLDLVSEPPEHSLALPLGDGAVLYLDQPSLGMMRGTEIDYVRNGLNHELQFNNPNAQEYCGCGESFSIKGGSQ